MKKQFVDTLQEGDVVNDYFVATRKDLRDTQNGNKFLGMVSKDRTGDIGGVMWNNAVAAAGKFEVGDVVNVKATVGSYQERLQLRVDQVLPLRKGEFDLEDLVFVPEESSGVFATFRDLMMTVEHPSLAALVKAFFDDEDLMGRFATAAAGKKWHHAHPGGLVQHCYEMARIAETMCELFTQLDRDLLMTAILVHDIGKLDEMSHDLFVDYTTAGKLVGHLQMGCDMVGEKIKAIPDFPETLRLQLFHMILSHHGELENGSAVVPKTLEAIVLHHIDNLDAQANAFVRIVEETKGRRQEWSDYIGLIQRQVWTKGL